MNLYLKAVAIFGVALAAATIAINATADEVWLCAGQSNMQQGWGQYAFTPEEKTRVNEELSQLGSLEIDFWDFITGETTRLTPENARAKCAMGVSFAIRRAKATGGRVKILYIAAGGAPTEAFLSRARMCEKDASGEYKYPRLAAIANNPEPLERNADFPCAWVASVIAQRRKNMLEGYWWDISAMYNGGVLKIRSEPLTGILWYQGESNATRNVEPEGPTPYDYQLETLLAVIDELRGGKDIPFIMMGLPKIARPWESYRAAQKEACRIKGAYYVDTFAAGLGEMYDVHPRDKRPFADLANKAAEEALGKTAKTVCQ